MKSVSLLTLAVLACSILSAQAQPGTNLYLSLQDADGQDSGGQAKADEQDGEEQEKTEDEKEIDKYKKAIEGLTLIDGPFPIYQKERDVLLVLHEDQIGKLFMMQSTLSSGIGDGLQAGDPLGHFYIDAFFFRKNGKEDVQLVKPNLAYRFDPNNPLATAAGRSIPDAILANYEIVARNPKEKLLLVNVTDMFDGSLYDLDETISTVASGSYHYDSTNSKPLSIKGFGENTVIKMGLHYSGSGGGGDDLLSELLGLLGINGPALADTRSVPIDITYNLWYQKDHDYQARLADPRVGYFTTDYFDVSKLKQVDRQTKLINRFHLEKKDPNAELSEPVQPIVWTLDSSIPEEYREGVKRGILFWNKAYEAIGYKNAIVVQDQPDDPNYDHADGRYNVVRWVFSESAAYAVAMARTSPITGEILNASVTVDANYPASTLLEYKEQIVGTNLREPWFDSNPATADLQTKLNRELIKSGAHKIECSYAKGKLESARLGYAVLRAMNVPVDLHEYTNSMVADLVAHEIGHCLGLRHNFAASQQFSMSQLTDDALLQKKAIGASVMDYMPINVAAILKGGSTYWNPTIGVYDMWAIAYGYQEAPGLTTETEQPFLNKIASKSGLPGHIYLTDEDADGLNPLAVRWDLSNEPLKYASMADEAALKLKNYALNFATSPGEPYTRRNALILKSLRAKYNNASDLTRLIGGVEFRRQFKGDLGEKPTLKPVSAELQRQAMKMIVSSALMSDSVDLPQSVLYGLSGAPDAGGADYNAPLRAYLGAQQRLVVSMLMVNSKLDAIAENAFKVLEGDRYTLVEHYKYLTTAVFAELGTGDEVPELRRDLQRYYLTNLMNQVNMTPGSINDDARAIAGQHIKQIAARLKQELATGKYQDEMTKLHYADMLDKIVRFEQRRIAIPPAS